MRIVGTLTTVPHRLDKIKDTLISIKTQTRPLDEIYLTLPKVSRKGILYSKVSEEYNNLCKVVNIDTDYGSVCKILGALYMESDPDTLFISFDDDIIYPNTIVESMLNKHDKYPNAALSSIGVIVGKFPFYLSSKFQNKGKLKEGDKVDILYGCAGILYNRKFFPPKEFLYEDFLEPLKKYKYLTIHDDIYISSYLESKSIPRIVVDYELIEEQKLGLGISSNKLYFWKTFAMAVYESWENNLMVTTELKDCTSTITYPIVLILFLILVFMVVVLLFFCLEYYPL